MFSSSDPNIVDMALTTDIFKCFTTIFEIAPTHIISLALFGLSNIAAGTRLQSRTIMLETELLEKVFQLTMNADVKLRSEALWILCNLIASSADDDLLTVVLKYRVSIGEVDLIHPLCYNLTKVEETKLMLEMINSIEKLLSLDSKFSNVLQG